MAYDWETWELSPSAPVRESITYRLPSEAEWERAAAWDGGRHIVYGFGADELAGTARANHRPVGGVPANPLGLLEPPFTSPAGWYDGMNLGTEESLSPENTWDASGNVMEWCHDRYSGRYYSSSPSVNPLGPESNTRRVVRGGGWNSRPGDCRTANRHDLQPTTARDDVGFRIVAATQRADTIRSDQPGRFLTPTPSPTPTPTPTPAR
ncbi:SUMF1/EgtB/PvdO family nonheme iron enzyme [Candidatus Poribacteria bacterium]|nr:SUMF1/EgtB/PvdO family nonheme iron enzyme [Candidatus Poribacteria bacterium]